MEKLYGLLGRRLGHSWSEPIHKMLGCPSYRLIELEEGDLVPFLHRAELGGVNVTIPYKRKVLACCDVIDRAAAEMGSVNTIVRREDGLLYAYNTDLAGFLCLAEIAGISFAGKKVVVLGSGGASHTVQAAARQAGARAVAVISRSGPDNYEALDRHADGEILVNATPVGMYPGNGASPVELSAFPACQGVLDLVYNPRRTALLQQAEALGLPHADGLPMLVAQAAAAEELFTGNAIPGGEISHITALLRREMTNLVLIGMPGCGKSAVGAALAACTGREAVDLDRLVEQRAGVSIPEIFSSGGEGAFRALEREAVEAAGKRCGLVLITGGGVVKDSRNYVPLHQNGRIYHLQRPLDALSTVGRPLSQRADLAAMWAEREPLYRRFRDAEVDNSGTIEQTADVIWRDFCEHSGD